MRRTIFILLYSIVLIGGLRAELETSVEVTALGSCTRDAAGALLFGIIGKGDIVFSAAANPNVKAETELLGYWSGSLVTDPRDLLKRLFVKVDFGGVHLLTGKARVSWGEGFVFNAGDVVFGSIDPVADLTQTLLRDQTDWLVDLTVSLGPLSYVEGLFLPYSTLEPSGFPYTDVYHLRGGGRFVTDLAGLKIETGYLFKADEAVHHPYLSLQGSLFFDFNLSASLKIPAVDYTDEKLERGLALSAGLFRMFQFEGGTVLTVRLEAAVRPFGLWGKPAVSSGQDIFGLLLYPEIALSPNDFLTLQLRSFINPINTSGIVQAGVSIGLYQGLNLLGYIWTMWGDSSNAIFRFGKEGDIGVYIGINFIY